MGSTPQWEWINQSGGIFTDAGNAICTDNNGNSYVTGYFNDTATFSNILLTSKGNTNIDNNIFVGKLDPSGNWQWVAHPKSVSDCQGLDISVDSANNSYITGYFRDTISFDNINLSTSSISKGNIFVAKLNPNGSFLWAIQAGNMNESYSIGKSIKVDCDGNSYVSGSFRGTATFGTLTITAKGPDNPNIFVAKVDTMGNWKWVTNAGGILSDSGEGISLDCDNNIYVTGYFRGTATFGTTILTGNNLSEDAFIAKLDEDGNWIWITQVGGINADGGLSISAECPDNVYVTGFFKNTATFGSTILTSIGNDDIFIAKLDGSTGTWEWAKRAGSADPTGDQGLGIGIDAEGNSYVTGFFNSTATFGTTILTSFGESDIFVTKLDCDGNWKWAINAGGKFSDQGLDISVDLLGNVYVTGSFQSTSTFGTTVLTTFGGSDIFVAKLSTTNSITNLNLKCFLEKANSITISFNYLKCLKYDISYRQVGAMSFIAGPTVDGNSNGSIKTVTIDSLIPNTEYEFKVDSIYKCGSIIDSDTITCRTVCIDSEWEWITQIELIPSTGLTSFYDILVACVVSPGLVYSILNGYITGYKDVVDIIDRYYYSGDNAGGCDEILKLQTKTLLPGFFGISSDCDNNVYITNSFEGTATFGTFVLTSTGRHNIFVAKLDDLGNTIWVNQAGSTDSSDSGYDIKVDKFGNSYVTGYFKGTSTFGSIVLTSVGYTGTLATSYPDIFIAKLNPTGNWEWVTQIGAVNNDYGNSIVLDDNGNSYVTGSFSNTIILGSTILTSSGSTDIFVCKVTNTGGIDWITKAGGIRMDVGNGIGIDIQSNLYITGSFEGTATFGSLIPPLSTTNITTSNMFVAKLDKNGDWLWADQTFGQFENKGLSIATACNGDNYVTGYFKGTATFDSITLTSLGNSDIFVSKIDKYGNWKWTKQVGNSLENIAMDISVDCYNNAYISGYFTGTINFDNILLSSSTTGYSGFVSKIDNNGKWEWAKNISSNGTVISNGIHSNCDGDIYTSGFFIGTTIFDNTTIISNPIDYANIFIAKIPSTNCPPESLTLECLEKATAIDVIFSNYNACFTYTATLLGNTLITTTADPGVNRIGFTGLTSDTEYDFEVVVTDKCGVFRDSGDITCRTLCYDPVWEWIDKAGGSRSDFGTHIVTDQYGNYYIGGIFTGTATFGSLTPITSGTNTVGKFVGDIFIGKINITTTDWEWVNTVSGDYYIDDDDISIIYGTQISQIIGLDVDCDGNCYVTGYSNYTNISFGSITFTDKTVNSFFAKITNTTGNWEWIKPSADIPFDSINTSDILTLSVKVYRSLVVDKNSDIYVLESDGVISINILKYDSDGNIILNIPIVTDILSGIGGNLNPGTLKLVDILLFLRLAGNFSLDLNNNIYLVYSGYSNIYILKFNSFGKLEWETKADNYGITLDNNDIDEIIGIISLPHIAVDCTGNSYITGVINGSVSFTSGTIGSIEISSSDVKTSNIFVAKLDTNGNWLWATQSESENSSIQFGTNISVDCESNVYINGLYTGISNIGNTILTTPSNDIIDNFTAKLDKNGNWEWAIPGGSNTDFNDYPFITSIEVDEFDFKTGGNIPYTQKICTDCDGNTYITGFFNGTSTFITITKLDDFLSTLTNNVTDSMLIDPNDVTSADLSAITPIDPSSAGVDIMAGISPFRAMIRTSEDIFVAKIPTTNCNPTYDPEPIALECSINSSNNVVEIEFYTTSCFLYNVFIKESSDPDYPLNPEETKVGNDDTQISEFCGLNIGNTYTFKVELVDKCGNILDMDECTLSIPGAGALPLLLECGCETSNSITICFNTLDNDQYIISYKQEGGMFVQYDIIDGNGSILMITINNLDPDTTYVFRVVAQDQGLTNETTCMTLSDTPPPSDIPLLLSCDCETSRSITISFNAMANVEYTISYKPKDAMMFTFFDMVQVTQDQILMIPITGLEPDTEYIFRVEFSDNNSIFKETECKTLEEGATNLELLCGMETDTTITVSFNTRLGNLYDILRSTNNEPFVPAIQDIPGTGDRISQIVNNLFPNKIYKFMVNEKNAIGSIINSDMVTCTTTCILPGAKIKTAHGIKLVENIRAGDIVIDEYGNEVTVIHNIKFGGDRKKVIKFKKGCLGNGLPTADLHITERHPIKSPLRDYDYKKSKNKYVFNEMARPVESFVNKFSVTSESMSVRCTYALMTEKQSFILTNGIPVQAWGQQDFEDYCLKQREIGINILYRLL